MAKRTDIDTVNPLPEVTVEELQDETFDVELPEETEPAYIPLAAPQAFDANLAEFMDEPDLEALSGQLQQHLEQDKSSRSDWESIVEDGIDLLGFKIEELTEPFQGACGASHPLLSQAVVKFQAKAFKELFPVGGPVRTRIMGTITPERENQATRVRNYMNYQTTVEMTEYGPELDRLLFYTALFGSGFKKSYFDYGLGRPRSIFVKAQNFVIDYFATDLETCDRYTHCFTMSHNEIRRLQLAKIFREVDLSGSTVVIPQDNVKQSEDELHGLSQPATVEDQYEVAEMHVNLDLPGFEDPDGLYLPYIVTFLVDTGAVLSVRRNWREADQGKRKIVYFTHYPFVPGLGFYGYGYIHLIGGLAKTATSTMRQLVDAGTFANIPGGFKAHGVRIVSPDTPISPGEWRDANAPAGDLQKSLMPLPYKEPSPTLMKLLEFMVATGKEFADASDQIIAESTNYGPVGTTMALLEQSVKLYSAIHKRMHAAQTKDLRMLAQINSDFLPDEYPYQMEGAPAKVFKQDFDLQTIDVIPVSDPNMPTEAHRIAKINAILSIAQQNPAAHNMPAIYKDLYHALGVEAPERYFAQSQQPFSGDPITENANALMGTPLSPKMEQDHDSHIAVHAAILGNPAYSENMQLRQLITAHVQAHLSMKYKLDVVRMIGDPQLAQALMSGQQLPPEIENMVAVQAAQVVDALNKVDITKAQALAGEETDPAIRLQEMEMSLRMQKQELDYIKDMLKLSIEKDKLMLKETEIMINDANKDADREADIYKAKLGAKNATSKR